MSKLIYFDFKCPEGHEFEELVKPTDNTTKCPYCSKKAKRLISAARIDWENMGLSTDFPTCADKWEKARRQRSKTDNYPNNLKMY